MCSFSLLTPPLVSISLVMNWFYPIITNFSYIPLIYYVKESSSCPLYEGGYLRCFLSFYFEGIHNHCWAYFLVLILSLPLGGDLVRDLIEDLEKALLLSKSLFFSITKSTSFLYWLLSLLDPTNFLRWNSQNQLPLQLP